MKQPLDYAPDDEPGTVKRTRFLSDDAVEFIWIYACIAFVFAVAHHWPEINLTTVHQFLRSMGWLLILLLVWSAIVRWARRK